MTRKTAAKTDAPKNGIVALTESDLDEAAAAGVDIPSKAFEGVDGLNAGLEVIEFQDGDDLFLRKRPGRSK